MVKLTSCLTSRTTISCTGDRLRWVTTAATWMTRCMWAYWFMWPNTWQVRTLLPLPPQKPNEELHWHDPRVRSQHSAKVTSLLGSLGVTHHSTARVSITKFRYKLIFYSHSPTLKPSLTFSSRVRICASHDLWWCLLTSKDRPAGLFPSS